MVGDGRRILILAHEEVTVRRNRQIVAIAVVCRIGRFKEQLQSTGFALFATLSLVARRTIAHDLTLLRPSSGGTGEVQLVPAPVDADRKSPRLNSSHYCASRMPSSV